MESKPARAGLYKVVRTPAERKRAYSVTLETVQAAVARVGFESVARELRERFDATRPRK